MASPIPAAGMPGAADRPRDVVLEYRAPGQVPVRALDLVGFDVPDGQFVSILGPSGCGKSTILKLVSGLLTPTSGDVRLDGEPIRGIPPSVGHVPERRAAAWPPPRQRGIGAGVCAASARASGARVPAS
jgi:NitT/TauT family transport system ATP-binding protein